MRWRRLATAALVVCAAIGALVHAHSQGTAIPVGAKNYFTAEEHWTPALSIFVVSPALQAENIKEAAVHAWLGYVRNAWGRDELLPLTGEGEDTFGGVGATIVDSLSTLYIMGLKDEYQRARNWVASELDFDRVGVRRAGSFFASDARCRDSCVRLEAVELDVRNLTTCIGPQ